MDPESHTSAKCNYCAHRKEVALKPACVAICPQQAIIAGDLDDPQSEIAILVAKEQTMVRKPEKGTSPKLFYINGDGASLDPLEVSEVNGYLWSEQSRGVGHFAGKEFVKPPRKSLPAVGVDGKPKARKVYDIPAKGVVWGWEVPAYVWSKAVASGLFLLMFVLQTLLMHSLSDSLQWAVWATSLFFLALTGGFLVKDLDRPERFSSVMLRPQFGSWLVKGGLTIAGFGAFLALWGTAKYLQLPLFETISLWCGALFALLTATYTAFLFGSAKGRDFWQSPMLLLHMFLNSLLAGGSAMLVLGVVTSSAPDLSETLRPALAGGFVLHILVMLLELFGKHPSKSAERAAEVILHGSLKKTFWYGSFMLGNVLPLLLCLAVSSPVILAVAAICGLCGVFYTEKVWIHAPQTVPLS